MNQTALQIAAYHEAGHAVVAVVSSIPGVVAYCRDEKCQTETGDDWNQGIQRIMAKGNFTEGEWAILHCQLVYTLAGAISEQRLTGTPSIGDAEDLDQFSKLLDDAYQRELPIERIRRAVQMNKEAHGLVHENWKVIEVVAGRLVAKGEVRGAEIHMALITGMLE